VEGNLVWVLYVVEVGSRTTMTARIRAKAQKRRGARKGEKDRRREKGGRGGKVGGILACRLVHAFKVAIDPTS